MPFLAGSEEKKENSQNSRCLTILANFADDSSLIYVINLKISVKIIFRLTLSRS